MKELLLQMLQVKAKHLQFQEGTRTQEVTQFQAELTELWVQIQLLQNSWTSSGAESPQETRRWKTSSGRWIRRKKCSP